MSRSSSLGQADLTAPGAARPGWIGSIQPHGLLLVLREPTLRIVQASTSAATWLQRPLDTLLLATVRELGGDLEPRLRALLAAEPLREPQPLRCSLGEGPAARQFEGCVHRTGADAVVLELEPSSAFPPATPMSTGEPAEAAHAAEAAQAAQAAETTPAAVMHQLSQAVQRFSEAPSVAALAAAAAQSLCRLSGYDRVVVSEIGADAHGGGGRVVAVAVRTGSAPLPAAAAAWSPPSASAQALHLAKRVRVVVDTAALPSELLPHLPPDSGGAVDLVLSELRSTSPQHAQRLREAGVRASMVVALAHEGRLWGLVTCHHARPRRASLALRAAAELLAEAFVTRLSALENHARGRAASEVRLLEQRLLEATSSEGDWRAALMREPRALLRPLQASGALLWHEGRLLHAGSIPAGPGLTALQRWVQDQSSRPGHPVACATLAGPATAEADVGALAVRLSTAQTDWLVWLRPAPTRAAAAEPGRGHEGLPWTRADLALAKALGAAVADMALQVNAVSLLIAQSQIARMRAAVSGATEALVVVDGTQRQVHANAAFQALCGLQGDTLLSLQSLVELFTQPDLAHRAMGQVRAEQRAWQGELALRLPDGGSVPVAVRAEPVPAADGSLLGTLFMFDDLREARHADAVRHRLESMLTRAGRAALPTDDHALVGALIANAGLAAMDITEGGERAAVAALLEAVEASTARATLLMRRIHAVGGPGVEAGQAGNID